MIACYVILVNRPFETEIAGIKLFFQKNDVLLTDNISRSFFLTIPVMLLSSGLTNALSENIWKVPTGSSTLIVLFLFRSLKQPSLTSLCYIMSYRISVCKRHCHNNFLSRCFLPAFPFFPHTEVSCFCYSDA